jgi:hypothetical protein
MITQGISRKETRKVKEKNKKQKNKHGSGQRPSKTTHQEIQKQLQ